jgi:hypothetical protein
VHTRLHSKGLLRSAAAALPDWQAAASFTCALGRFAADPLA